MWNICCRANIVGCIICPNACVAGGSELRDCLVGSGQSVSGNIYQPVPMLSVAEWCRLSSYTLNTPTKHILNKPWEISEPFVTFVSTGYFAYQISAFTLFHSLYSFAGKSDSAVFVPCDKIIHALHSLDK